MILSCKKVVTCLSHPLLLFSLSLVILNLVQCGRVKEGKNPVSSRRDPKLMYLPFVKVVIPPEPCGEANVNGIRSGVCLPLGKCGKVQGVAGGTCSFGFGECCTISTNCTADRKTVDVWQYVTTLKTPVDPTTTCNFRLRKLPDVCQVRLDFQTFVSHQADENGHCVKDRLIISDSITVADGFTTCGNLGGQHMYLTFGSSESIDLTPIITELSSQYTIIATQIPCYSKRVVPSHCLQYFNNTMDTVRSFDYPRQQQSTQQYTICVEAPERSQRIMWKPCTDNVKPFYISAGEPADTTCNKDYIQINGEARRCGAAFPQMVSSTWKPYTMNVHFDNSEIPDLPFPAIPDRVDSAASCAALGASSGGLLICDWFENACTCQYSINLQPIFGSPDLNNTGFCLQYQL